ncbi:hypothetical protein RvVAR0630_05540 [Agrobacterium vitis]|nr:hypothetical protein RvVAR0630_05540 [Agrobacterium vitis]
MFFPFSAIGRMVRDAVIFYLDVPTGQGELQTIPVFGDVSQSLAKRGIGCYTGTPTLFCHPWVSVG